MLGAVGVKGFGVRLMKWDGYSELLNFFWKLLNARI